MQIKFVDLPRQNKILKKKILKTLEGVVMHAEFSLGEKLEDFEKEFAKYCRKKIAVGVNSGTDALLLALMAYDIGVGDEVITSPNSYVVSAMTVNNVGATPIFVDINPSTYNIDVSKIEKAITKKTKAIIPVDLYGQPADMDEIMKIAKKYNLIVIEDACQAHGARYKSKRVPIAETGAFSFFPGKNLGCFGDGGAVVTDNKNIAEKIRYLRNDGSIVKYVHKMMGIKSRLDTLQAAVLSTKLPYLDSWNRKRRVHAKTYRELLKDIKEISLPFEDSNRTHVYHIFAIETARRDELKNFLEKKGIQVNVHYPIPIHLQNAYKPFGYKSGNFPITEVTAKKLLSLPMFPELTYKEQLYIANSIKFFFKMN